MRLTRLAGAATLGYLIGTFPTADLVTRRVSGGRVDLRHVGTGNPGGANAAKVLGAKAGAAVMAGDIAKGAIASALGALVAGPTGAHVGGSASVVGHCFPVWTGFRGGKGVAASVGQCLATFPAYFPIDLGIAALSTANRGRSGQGVTTKNGGRPLTGAGNARTATFASSAAWVLGGLVWWRRRWPNLWGPTPSAGLPAAAAVSSAVIAYKFLTAHTPADIAHEAVDEAVAA